MATNNQTRLHGRHKKRDVSVLTFEVNFDELVVDNDVYQMAVLPSESYLLSCNVIIVTPDDAGTSSVLDVGVDGTVDNLHNGINLKAAAGTNVASSTRLYLATGGIVTALVLRVGTAETEGKAICVIEYIELDKATGELTNFV